MTMDFRAISAEQLVPALFDGFQRHQEVTQVWRKENGAWVIRDCPRLIENWDEAQHEFICHCLRETLADGGAVMGAFSDGRLKGIVAVVGVPMGSRGQYCEVSFLQVSRECRGQGIGRKLFALAKAFAREQGAEKLFISSHPAVESQAFYRAMGCVETQEYSAAHAAYEPSDRQIECSL